jgi:hypothetical protein
LERFGKIEIILDMIYDCMCNYVKVYVEYNRGQSDHIILYKRGKIVCQHANNSVCIQLDEDALPLTKSSHSNEKYIYYISTSRIDTFPYIPNDPLFNIRNKLSKLNFGIVNTIECGDIKYIRKYTYHPTNRYTFSDVDANDILSLLDKNVRIGYDAYRGTAGEVNFDKNTHAYYEMCGLSIGTLKYANKDESPPVNSLICGTIHVKEGSAFFDKWFRCSQQFYILYLLLTFGKQHHLFSGKNKNQILDLLETNKSLKVIEKPTTKEMNYVHLDVEPSAIEYCDIYKSIAEIFYFQSDIPIPNRKIPETYRIPSKCEIYKLALLEAFG